MDNRESILTLLSEFAESPPGMTQRDYAEGWRDAAGLAAYYADRRRVLRDLRDARNLLRYVRWHESISAADIIAAMGRDRRLTYDAARQRLDYCTGQYYPTEYRSAVCLALVSVLWTYWREPCGGDTGDKIRACAKRELPRALARRYFA